MSERRGEKRREDSAANLVRVGVYLYIRPGT